MCDSRKFQITVSVFVLFLHLLTISPLLIAQAPEKVLASVFEEALTDVTAYKHLEYLCKNTKGRLDGSPAAAKGVEYTRQALISAGADVI